MQSRVYLAGPITGLNYDEGQGWRITAAQVLSQSGIVAMSPLRAKGFLRSEGPLKGAYPNPLSTEKGITTRDRFDVQRADVVLFNLAEAKIVSIGTCIEFGWADAYRKPMVVIPGELHSHPMINELSAFLAENLKDALEIVKKILLP